MSAFACLYLLPSDAPNNSRVFDILLNYLATVLVVILFYVLSCIGLATQLLAIGDDAKAVFHAGPPMTKIQIHY